MSKQAIYTGITKIAAWLKKGQRIKTGSSPVKVNLGSGLAVYGDWINVDVNFNILLSGMPRFILKIYYNNSGAKDWYGEQEFMDILKKHRFVHHRFEYGLPFNDNSVDYVYSSHTLEHFFKDDAEKLMAEAYRILRPGGIIRTCIPDLEYALQFYTNGDKEKALSYFFPKTGADYTSRHQYMYDFELLSKLLESTGFTNIKKCSYQQGLTPDIENMDTRPDETLFVEAEKL